MNTCVQMKKIQLYYRDCMYECYIFLSLIIFLPCYFLSAAHQGWGMEELLEEVWAKAEMIRIYTKPKGQIPDYGAPVVLHAESPSIEYFCNKLHKGILSQFKYAWVWGSSVRHQPQKCGKDHILHDEDVIQIIKKI